VNTVPEFTWPRCPDCDEEIIVGTSYLNDEPDGYFSSCPSCTRRSDGPDALKALQAFVEEHQDE